MGFDKDVAQCSNQPYPFVPGDMAHDVESLFRAYQQLAAEYQQLTDLHERAPVGCVTFDAQGRILNINHTAIRMLGLESTPVGRSFDDFLSHSVARVFQRHLREVLVGDGRHSTWLHITDELCVQLDSIALGLGESGERTFWSVLADVSQHERTQMALRAQRDFAESLLDTAQAIVLVLDPQGRVVRFNSYMEALSGYRLEEVQGKDWFSIFLPAHEQERISKLFSKAIADSRTRGNINVILTKSGAERHIQWHDKVLKDAAGCITGVLAVGHDVTAYMESQAALVRAQAGLEQQVRDRTEALTRINARLRAEVDQRRHTQAALHREKELALTALGSIDDAVITVDKTGTIVMLNAAARDLTGWKESEAQGRHYADVVRLVAGAGKARDHVLARCVKSGRRVQLGKQAVLCRHDDGEVAVHGSATPLLDRSGKVERVVLVLRDVTEARKTAQRLYHQAVHDPLTNLYNRREFEHRLERVIASAHVQATEHAVCYLDLDQFKVVNDSCGHPAGDDLLRQISARLQAKMRRRDTLARLGGDEFGVLLELCPLDQAWRIANELREVVADFRYECAGKSYQVGVSIGVVPVNAASPELAAVLAAADAACYVAKDEGRNRVHVHMEGEADRRRRQSERRSADNIISALEEQRLMLYLQPAMTLGARSNALPRYQELLVRIGDAQGDVILPAEFVPIAERYNLMPAVDRWVVREALHLLGGQEEAQSPLITAINLSGASWRDERFMDFLREQFAQSGVAPNAVCFELNEIETVESVERAIHFMRAVKELGCRVALDRVGAGKSCLAYFKSMAVDYYKIDAGVIAHLADDPVERAMVESINSVGHALAARTVALGVGSLSLLEPLRELSVDYVQGYAHAHPQRYPSAAEPEKAL